MFEVISPPPCVFTSGDNEVIRIDNGAGLRPVQDIAHGFNRGKLNASKDILGHFLFGYSCLIS